ncbi:Lanthionine synthetase [Lipomyces tetrasporus]
MSSHRPQYFPNKLHPIDINRSNLEHVLKELQSAVKEGVEIICNSLLPVTDASDYGSIYSGIPGVALALLRLERQNESIGSSSLHCAKLAYERIIPTPTDVHLLPGRMSPIGSSLGPVFLRILAVCEDHNLNLGRGLSVSPEDASALNDAVQRSLQHGAVISFKGHSLGGDEVLYGRAGLLWALLTIQKHMYEEKTEKAVRGALRPALKAVPQLIDTIIAAGKQGSRKFIEKHGPSDAFPLMWPWIEDYYGLGAVHGISGILTVLLSCDLTDLRIDEEDSYLGLIADTITCLCRICIANHGHLPMSIPPRPSSQSRAAPLLQICHGTPGLLVLLAAAQRNGFFTGTFWKPEWDVAIRLGTEKIWQEGILSKGGNLCHGLAGNAWPLLTLHDIFTYDLDTQTIARRIRAERLAGDGEQISKDREVLTGDYFLSRALPFMMLARESPPYSSAREIPSSYDFRTPDRPFSLYEGLAGQLCAWAETCAVIKGRLRQMELAANKNMSMVDIERDKTFTKCLLQQLGFPGLEVNGPDKELLLRG